MRIKLVSTVAAILLLTSIPAAPANAGQVLHAPEVTWSCSGLHMTSFDLRGDRITVVNPDWGIEEFNLVVTDGEGNILREPERYWIFAGWSTTVNEQTLEFATLPTANPISLQFVSLAGNGLPEQIVFESTGSCEDLIGEEQELEPGTVPESKPSDAPLPPHRIETAHR